MNNVNLSVSLKDTEELRKMILENPNLPLLIFCSKDVNIGNYAYWSTTNVRIEINEITLYKDIWVNKDDFEDELRKDLENNCADLTDKEYDEMIDKKIKETEFFKAIIIYCD